MEKKSFKFYTSWNEAIKKMDEQQVRTFINNLCNYAENKEIQLNGLMEEIMWSQVKPLLDYNEEMRQKKIENGRKGGIAKSEKKSEGNQELPNPTKTTKGNQTYQDLPMKEDDDVEDDSRKKMMIDDVDSRKKIVDKLLRFNKQYIDEGILSSEDVSSLKLDDVRYMIDELIKDKFPNWESNLSKKGYNDFCFYLRDNQYEMDYALDGLVKSYLVL